MKIANYRTRISRDKLKKAHYDPDASAWEIIGQVRETPEQYFQPAVEALDAIERRSRAI
ncbi:hypothetical protein [Paenibacillus sp. PAMC21692]|uniref:hypothetical protein n=1 Tax=Paenibacillus sp. PAMC21692 TaxID=2762320 RepID=UPI00164D2BD6|nr:hypothetical protein [Paenibacillus sp. PAMC21692]QNK57436.1 hypothetical protein H7F31_00065 [Paenibacillus sp. PAMC21692]